MDISGILDGYDIKRLKSRCNHRDCKKKPGKEILIYSFDRVSLKRKDLVSIYLCSEHYKKAEEVLKDKIKSVRDGEKILKAKVFDIGFVTH